MTGGGGSFAVMVCIACGRIDRFADCTGDCRDRRLDLVRADDLESVASALSAARESKGRLAGPLAGLREEQRSEVEAEAAYRRLRDEARRALDGLANLDETQPGRAPVAETWRCMTCGRIEAPQPCLGICVKHPVAMIEGSDYEAVRTELLDVLDELRRNAALLRQLVFVTPRPGHWSEALEALAKG